MKIAVIGGGISGLMAAYLLARRDRHDVRLFEAAPRLGGHTDTVSVREGRRELALDLGFIVFNRRTYSGLVRLLDELDVACQPSEMSFSVRCERCGLEYNGSGLGALFAQRRNLLRPKHYRMLVDILRFHRLAAEARRLDDEATFGDFLARHRLRGPVVSRYLVPMIAAIWSTDPARMADFPVRTLISFLDNHGMLTVNDRPRWRVVRGGSQRYVAALRERLGDHRLRAGTPVLRVIRDADPAASTGGVEVVLGDRRRGESGRERFDQVVMAVHSDQALALLVAPSDAEGDVLGAIRYQDNEVVLHTDSSFLPRRRRARASWNYHLGVEAQAEAPNSGPSGVRMTYYLNRLQGLEGVERDYCVTLNRGADIDPATVLARRTMAHPQYDVAATAAQARWAEISGVDRVHYCGAYWRWGFHEDGLQSAVRVAEALGAPW